MAYAMKRRLNRGQPKSRAQNVKTRNSKMFARGQRAAAKLVAGRRLNPQKSQAEIRKEIHALMHKHGSKSDVDLLTGPAGKNTDAHQFRQGVASVAADLAGFKPSSSSGRKPSRAAESVKEEYSRDRKDTKKKYNSQSAKAMRLYHSGEASSLAEAWRIVKGESKPKRKSKSKSSSRRKKSSSRRSRARRNPSRDFGAEFLFI